VRHHPPQFLPAQQVLAQHPAERQQLVLVKLHLDGVDLRPRDPQPAAGEDGLHHEPRPRRRRRQQQVRLRFQRLLQRLDRLLEPLVAQPPSPGRRPRPVLQRQAVRVLSDVAEKRLLVPVEVLAVVHNSLRFKGLRS
jgi:hypothetical protein